MRQKFCRRFCLCSVQVNPRACMPTAKWGRVIRGVGVGVGVEGRLAGVFRLVA